MQSFVGHELQAITLTHFDGEFTEALTDNYLKLRLSGRHAANQWMRGAIQAIENDALIGRCAPLA
jgi:hypothetical protein